jgi:hypothetical protein
MKIRNGFVSNSSSSSFLVISKNGELTTDKLIEVFGVPEASPLYDMSCELASEMFHSCEELTLDEYAENYYDDLEEFKQESPKKYQEFVEGDKKGWKIYLGSADSCDQATLCELGFDYEDDEIKIEKESGY